MNLCASFFIYYVPFNIKNCSRILVFLTRFSKFVHGFEKYVNGLEKNYEFFKNMFIGSKIVSAFKQIFMRYKQMHSQSQVHTNI
jgi:hypothetical protein